MFNGFWRIFLDPWDPWGQINSGDIRVLIFVLIFCVGSAALANFFTYMKMLSNVNFISMAIKKVFFQPQFQSFQRNTTFEGIIRKGFGANT